MLTVTVLFLCLRQIIDCILKSIHAMRRNTVIQNIAAPYHSNKADRNQVTCKSYLFPPKLNLFSHYQILTVKYLSLIQQRAWQ